MSNYGLKQRMYFHYFSLSQYSQPNVKTGKGILCCMCGLFFFF